MKTLKVVFSSSIVTNLFYLSPIFWFLKLHHETFGKSKKDWTWSSFDPVIDIFDTSQEILVNQLLSDKVDLIAFSMYSWNRDVVLSMCRIIKERNPKIIIVVGGPDVEAHRDPDFMKINKSIDYSIYGDGEDAFTRLLDHLSGHEVDLINLVDSQGTIYRHEVFNDKSALSKSPLVEYKKEYFKYFKYLKKQLKLHGIEKDIVPVWETTKGCPYACSFCDWSSGLHNKVRIWGKDELIPTWQKEIDMFFDLQETFDLETLSIEWTNPNIGLTRQDEEIVDYWSNLRYKKGKGPIIQNPQLSKLNKNLTFRLLDKMIGSRMTAGFKFDVQDLDEQVLKNIDRPEIPWEDHKQLILNLKQKWKNKEDWFLQSRNKYKNKINFIWGLPGQTLDHLKTNLGEAGSIRSYAHVLPFDLLPNSPAFNLEYRTKFELQFKRIEFLGHGDLYRSNLVPNLIIDKAVVSTFSLSEYNYYKGLIIFNLYSIFYSESVDLIYGYEKNFFENISEIQNSIDAGYAFFKKTGQIGLVDDNKLISVYDYFLKNREMLSQIFKINIIKK